MANIKTDIQWSPETGVQKAEQVVELDVTQPDTQDDEELFDSPLKQKDLLQPENLSKIRDYMVRRKGTQFNEKAPEEVVDDFVEHMRYFNSNLVSTAGEVRFISTANDRDKQAANQAYQLYDQLGNVFVNDGFFGAIEGVGDYIYSAATDPSNYIGAATGGLGKMGALGVTKAGRAAAKAAAKEAAKKATMAGATRQAAKEAGDVAAKSTIERLAFNNVKGDAAKRVAGEVAKLERRAFLQKTGAEAYKDATAGAYKKAAKRALYGTAALDATAGAMNEHEIQNVMLEVGAQEEYSRTQTALGSLFGVVGTGAQIVGRAAGGRTGMEGAEVGLAGATTRKQQKDLVDSAIAFNLKEPAVKDATKVVRKAFDSWEKKYTRGNKTFGDVATPTDLIHDIMLGENGKGGLARVLKKSGVRINKNLTVSDLMTNVVRQLPEKELAEINAKLELRTGITLGRTSEMGKNLGDLLAKDIRSSAQSLNVMSQVAKTLNSGLMHGNNIIDGIVKSQDTADDIAKEAANLKRSKPVAYAQSVWRRLLVSSPATSMINLVGFTQYNAGQSFADLLSYSGLMMSGMVRGGEAGAERMKMARVYKDMQVQKMRNFADPYATYETYMALLNQNKKLKSKLFESFTGGVDRTTAKFNMNPKARGVKITEAVVEGAGNITGVRIQDTFTKSQMFVTELDKHMRLSKGKSLSEVMATGTIDELDDEVIGNAMTTTLKSVYSADYTQDDQMLGQVAKLVEGFSNTPVLGTVLPFGRFLNNTVATVHQWGPTSLVPTAVNVARKSRQAGVDINATEAFARSAVGTTGLLLAMQYDKERQAKGLAYNEVEVGGGTIVDAKNTFPFSYFLVMGRMGNLLMDGQTIPKELYTEFGAQVAVGQFASDVQFGNDMQAAFDAIANQTDGQSRMRSVWEAFLAGTGKAAGNVAAGFTRPLDPINRAVGFIEGTDAARDLRQAEPGVQTFTQASTRYVDNIFEALIGKAESVTGEELRVATRGGPLLDANPLARIFGFNVRPTRTATEQAYSMADMAEWTASQRSNMPEYDKIFNSSIAPILEGAMDKLIRNPKYIEGNTDTRKVMLNSVLTDTRKSIRDAMKASTDPETRLAVLRKKAKSMETKELRTEASKAMSKRFNIDASVDDMSIRELQFYMEYIDHLKDYYTN